MIDIWNASNGKIMASIDTKMILIYDLEYKNSILSVVGIVENNEIKSVQFKGYLIEIKVNKLVQQI